MEVNNTPDTMTSSSQVLEKLKQKNITDEFEFNGAGLSINNGRSYGSNELEILKTYRFEGISNPDDMEVIYIVKTNDGLTGYIQDTYGNAANEENQLDYNNFLRQIPESGHDQQIFFEL